MKIGNVGFNSYFIVNFVSHYRYLSVFGFRFLVEFFAPNFYFCLLLTEQFFGDITFSPSVYIRKLKMSSRNDEILQKAFEALSLIAGLVKKRDKTCPYCGQKYQRVKTVPGAPREIVDGLLVNGIPHKAECPVAIAQFFCGVPVLVPVHEEEATKYSRFYKNCDPSIAAIMRTKVGRVNGKQGL